MTSLWLIAAWLLGCLVGLTAVDRYPAGLDSTPAWVSLALAGLSALAVLLSRRDTKAWQSALLIATLLAGAGWSLRTHPTATPATLEYYTYANPPSAVRITGTIEGEPVYTDRTARVRVRAEQVSLAGQPVIPVSGSLLALLSRYPQHYPGERITLTGTLTRPPTFEDFDYAAYLAKQGVRAYMRYPKVATLGHGEDGWFNSVVSAARTRVRTTLQRSLPEPQAGLAVGIVTGDRSSMPTDLLWAFQTSGTTHILAISGQNIALIVGFVWLLYSTVARDRRMPAWLVLALLACLGFYTAFTGATPSVVRAAVMGGILLVAPLVHRRYDPLAALALPAFLMTIIDPDVLQDAGFQLSFFAMLGMALFSPRIYSALKGLPIPGVLAVALAAGLGAQAATLPLIAILTGRVSLVSPLATMTTEFLLLPLMIAGIITALLGMLFAPLGAIAGWIVWFCGSWMITSVKFWAALPGAAINLQGMDLRLLLAAYLLLLAALFAAPRLARNLGRVRVTHALNAALLTIAASVWLLALALLAR